jgi:hypothetical protein
MLTAEYFAVVFIAMADDATSAMLALGRERVDRALERVEGVPFAIEGDRERISVVVSTNFADSHDDLACLLASCRCDITRWARQKPWGISPRAG